MIIFLLILNFFQLTLDRANPVEGKYKVLPESKVYLEGTTNVNKFKCDCGNNFESKVYRIQSMDGNKIVFSNTILLLPVTYFDCKNRKMDRDLQKALKADQFPEVHIELHSFSVNSSGLGSNDGHTWTSAKAQVSITLAGKTQRHEILVKSKKGSPVQWIFNGKQSMKMTDFNITPPEALFGMIKVNDQITFYFDLVLELEQNEGHQL